MFLFIGVTAVVFNTKTKTEVINETYLTL